MFAYSNYDPKAGHLHQVSQPRNIMKEVLKGTCELKYRG